MNAMMKIMNMILPSCEEVSRLTSQEIDESLPWQKRIAKKTHLIMCVWCRRNDEQLKLIQNLARNKASSETKTSKLDSVARQRIAKALGRNND